MDYYVFKQMLAGHDLLFVHTLGEHAMQNDLEKAATQLGEIFSAMLSPSSNTEGDDSKSRRLCTNEMIRDAVLENIRVTDVFAAEFMGETRNSLACARSNGQLGGRKAPPFIKQENGNIRYRLIDLIEWMNGELPACSNAEHMAMRRLED